MSRNSEGFLGERIAEESQLLAEERWIIEALTKIRKQRNSLEIERLHLDSLRKRIAAKSPSKRAEKVTQPRIQNGAQTPSSSGSTHELKLDVVHRNTIELDSCNHEELDLAVSKSVFSQEFRNNVLEEYEEEDEDDLVIDMNMFMNSKQ